ncbi:MAG: hypothetical protein DYG96_13480 [Chlorobi bacterium CHB2]|nr:hypothetical protein [Chlorobi bacterium CHB2]
MMNLCTSYTTATMRGIGRRLATAFAVLAFALLCGTLPGVAQSLDPRAWDIGEPGPFLDVYVSPTGSDANNGLSRQTPVRNLRTAWARMTDTLLANIGYRINLMAGDHTCETPDCVPVLMQTVATTRQHPIIIRAADGAGSATVVGGLTLQNASNVYLMDFSIRSVPGQKPLSEVLLGVFSGQNILLRNLRLIAPDPVQYPSNSDVDAGVGILNSANIHVEQCTLQGQAENGMAVVGSQNVELLKNVITQTTEWGVMAFGGTAYFKAEANIVRDCRRGISIGDASVAGFLVAPWVHYEVYDARVVNNLLHDVTGVPLRVAGGYNVLMAWNTLYRVAFDDTKAAPLFEAVHGIRSCEDDSLCRAMLATGGWGSDSAAGQPGPIPNRNVYLYNNVFFNPLPARTLVSHFAVDAPIATTEGTNIPNPSRADQNVRIKGNVIWNGGSGQHGILMMVSADGREPGCDPQNIDCNEIQLKQDNSINEFAPELVDPTNGNYAPKPGGNLISARTFIAADFSWADAPANPPVPSGSVSNGTPLDFSGGHRPAANSPGAFSGVSVQPIAPSAPSLIYPLDKENGISINPILQWSAAAAAGSYRVQLSTSSDFTTVLLEFAGVTATSISVPDLNTATTYHWRVQSRNNVGVSDWSETRSFNTQPATLGAPTLIAPANQSPNAWTVLDFQWSPVPETQYYLLHIATDPGFTNPVKRIRNIQGTTLNVGILPNSQTLYWHVRAESNAGLGPWSETWSLTTATSGVASGKESAGMEVAAQPNPATGLAQFTATIPHAGAVRLRLVDALGNSVATIYDGELEAGATTFQHDLAGLPAGIYFVRLQAAWGAVNQSLVVAR